MLHLKTQCLYGFIGDNDHGLQQGEEHPPTVFEVLIITKHVHFLLLYNVIILIYITLTFILLDLLEFFTILLLYFFR